MCPPGTFNLSSQSNPTQPPPYHDITTLIPDSALAKSAYTHASSLLAPTILHHSIRVYLYAKTLAEQTNSAYVSDPSKHGLLFTSCILHDIGTTSQYNGHQRFEVEGGDAAVKFLSQFSISEEDSHQVWMAISLHTTPGIAERINELSSLVRKAVLADFGRCEEIVGFGELKGEFESQFQRGDVEKVLGDAIVEQAKVNPQKAPKASWPSLLYQAYLAEPEWEGVNKGF